MKKKIGLHPENWFWIKTEKEVIGLGGIALIP